MNNLKIYDIKFAGLKNGEHSYKYKLDNAFFDMYNYDEFNNSNINVVVNLLKNGNLLEFSIHTQGTVNVPCDISGEKFDQAVSGKLDFIVKFGDEYNDDNDSLIIIPYNAHTFNVAQQIYESVLLNVPSKRIHPDIISGKMKTNNTNFIINYDDDFEEETKSKIKEIDPRWEALKNILTDKKK